MGFKRKILGFSDMLKFDKVFRKINFHPLTIICLHRISPEISPAYPPLNPEVFEQLLIYFKQNFDVIPLHQIQHKYPGTNKPKLCLTFDDGYKDFIQYAFPLIQKYELAANLNIICSCADSGKPMWTQRLNKIVETYATQKKQLEIDFGEEKIVINTSRDNIDQAALILYKKLLCYPHESINDKLDALEYNLSQPVQHTEMLNWEEIQMLHANNIAIGSHTIDHINLGNEHLTEEELNREIVCSKQIIYDKTGIDTKIFAFPNGQYTEKALNISLSAGYDQILLVGDRFPGNNLSLQAPLILPRIDLSHHNFIENKYKSIGLQSSIKRFLAWS